MKFNVSTMTYDRRLCLIYMLNVFDFFESGKGQRNLSLRMNAWSMLEA
jgi:hypothetical protein